MWFNTCGLPSGASKRREREREREEERERGGEGERNKKREKYGHCKIIHIIKLLHTLKNVHHIYDQTRKQLQLMLDTINHNETVSMYRKSYHGDGVTLQKFANYQR